MGKALRFVGKLPPPKHAHIHTVDETLCILLITMSIIVISPSASLSGADSRACSELHISAYGEVYNNLSIIGTLTCMHRQPRSLHVMHSKASLPLGRSSCCCAQETAIASLPPATKKAGCLLSKIDHVKEYCAIYTCMLFSEKIRKFCRKLNITSNCPKTEIKVLASFGKSGSSPSS